MNYFNEILEINKKIIPEEDNIRINKEEINELCNKLNNFYSRDFNLDEFIKLCIILFNMQIFYDGNSRTILTYLVKVIDKYGYYIDIDMIKNNLTQLRSLFPTMYDLNEELNENMIFRIKQFIYTKNESKGRK